MKDQSKTDPITCKHKFKVTNISGWKHPSPEDSCWGWTCSKCGGIFATGFTKAQLKKMS